MDFSYDCIVIYEHEMFSMQTVFWWLNDVTYELFPMETVDKQWPLKHMIVVKHRNWNRLKRICVHFYDFRVVDIFRKGISLFLLST